MNYFFVFQNRTFIEESSGRFLWAPKLTSNGRTKSHWKIMKDVKKGDIIIHSVHKEIVAISYAKSDCYSSQRPKGNFNNWQIDGWRVDTEYYLFNKKIVTSDFMDKLQVLQPVKYAPFNFRGRGNTGYLFAANKEMYEFIIDMTAKVQKTKIENEHVLSLLKHEISFIKIDNQDNYKEINDEIKRLSASELQEEYCL